MIAIDYIDIEETRLSSEISKVLLNKQLKNLRNETTGG